MARVAIIAPLTSSHTQRWIKALSSTHELHVLTMHPGINPDPERITIHSLKLPAPFGYVANQWQARTLIKRLRPDLVHAYFISGYGTLARLCKFHPLIISVWGTDITHFPRKSTFHRWLIRGNLDRADAVCATSKMLIEHVKTLSANRARVFLTPFGIDTDEFLPRSNQPKKSQFIVGTVRHMMGRYGIDVMLKAFSAFLQLLRSHNPELAERAQLVIVGDGPERSRFEGAANDLGIAERTRFTGRLPHHELPSLLTQFDVFLALSRWESFGVALLEASSCGIPVVASHVGGIPEIVDNGKTGLLVPANNAMAAAEAMLQLALDPNLRQRLGICGRRFVMERYQWKSSVETMERAYQRILQGESVS